MIYGWTNSTKGIRHSKLFANLYRCRILHFAMPGNSAGSLGGGIVVDAVLSPFAEKNAAICLQVAN
jgi:hypothetical protein